MTALTADTWLHRRLQGQLTAPTEQASTKGCRGRPVSPRTLGAESVVRAPQDLHSLLGKQPRCLVLHAPGGHCPLGSSAAGQSGSCSTTTSMNVAGTGSGSSRTAPHGHRPVVATKRRRAARSFSRSDRLSLTVSLTTRTRFRRHQKRSSMIEGGSGRLHVVLSTYRVAAFGLDLGMTVQKVLFRRKAASPARLQPLGIAGHLRCRLQGETTSTHRHVRPWSTSRRGRSLPCEGSALQYRPRGRRQ